MVHLGSGEIWQKDLLHGDHWKMYKNPRDFDRGRRGNPPILSRAIEVAPPFETARELDSPLLAGAEHDCGDFVGNLDHPLLPHITCQRAPADFTVDESTT